MHNDRCSEMMVELQRTIVHASFGETGSASVQGKERFGLLFNKLAVRIPSPSHSLMA